jgi:hypothetical protein
MKLTAGLVAAAAVLVGCGPAPPQLGADIPRASVQGSAVARGNVDNGGRTESSGGLPSMPWPKVQAGLATRADEAELAIILRCHELRDQHPGATPSELAEMLAQDDMWKQNAQFVPSARRTFVIREALGLL